METKKTTEQILYGDCVYVSAVPYLVWSAVSDAFENLIGRLVEKFNRSK